MHSNEDANSLGYGQKVDGARLTPAALRVSSSAVAVPVVIRSPLPVKYRLPQLVAPAEKSAGEKHLVKCLEERLLSI